MKEQKPHSGFARGFAGMKGGAFRCSACGKLTRDTGENGSVGLCPCCYLDNIIENMISDGMPEEDIEKYEKEYDEKCNKKR